jgi:predicted NAD-dependent protein-ADP-ribosyltransferase YbiA (DUF1768 family)
MNNSLSEIFKGSAAFKIVCKVFENPSLLYDESFTGNGGNKQLDLFISHRLREESELGDLLRDSFNGVIQNYGKSSEDRVVLQELRHVLTMARQVDEAFEDSIYNPTALDPEMGQSHLINQNARNQLKGLLKKYKQDNMSSESIELLKIIESNLNKYSDKQIEEWQAKKRELEAAAAKERIENPVKFMNTKTFAPHRLNELHKILCTHSGREYKEISFETLFASEKISVELKEEINSEIDFVSRDKGELNKHLSIAYWQAFILDSTDLQPSQIESLGWMAGSLVGMLLDQRINNKEESLVYADKGFKGYTHANLRNVKSISEKESLKKTQEYFAGWYTQGMISNLTTQFVISHEPQEAQKAAEKAFGPFINWNGGSNVHDSMPMDEPKIKWIDPFDGNEKEMPNPEFCFAYQKRYFFYQELMKIEKYKVVAEKIKEDSIPLIDTYMNQGPANAQEIGRKLLNLKTLGVDEGTIRDILSKWGTSESQKVMDEVVYLKCKQNPILREKLKLLALSERRLASFKSDTTWGTGLGGEGKNGLGVSQERARKRLLNEMTNR